MSEAWSIIVHGGAKRLKPEKAEANRRGCLAAVEAGVAILEKGGSAVDACVAAIKVLENDPTFNAGYGSVLNSDGEVEVDAAIMDGATLDCGAVAAMKGVRHPIEVARHLLHDRAVFLVGEGATRYAGEEGFPLCDPRELIPPKMMADEAHDTVGCVAFDIHGNVASGTSTGGLNGVRPGRVGDSPLPGCGLYAENGVGGVSFSGEGEAIIRLALAARLMADLEHHGAGHAAGAAMERLGKIGGEGGCIVLGARGDPDFAHNSDNFAVALATATVEPQAFLRRDEYVHA